MAWNDSIDISIDSVNRWYWYSIDIEISNSIINPVLMLTDYWPIIIIIVIIDIGQ